MGATDTTVMALQRNWGMVDSAISELDDAQMAVQPNDQSNSVSWLLWHMSRVADRFINSRLREGTQIWVKDGWHEKFGMDADPEDMGMGWSAEKVGAWQAPSKDVLVGYYDAVKSATQAFIQPLSPQELDKQIPFPAPPNTVSVAEALGVLVYDNVVHGGQIAYLRGYFTGMGWHR